MLLRELGGEGRAYLVEKNAIRAGNVALLFESRQPAPPVGTFATQAQLRLRANRNDVRFEVFMPWHGSWTGRAMLRVRLHLECHPLEIRRAGDWQVHPK